MIKVSAIVVTYNRLNLLKKCLAHLLHQSYKLNNIYVINNNSGDGTKQYLNNLHNSKIHPVNLQQNLNGAGGFSLGTKIAYKHSKSDAFWLMDDDTMPTKDSLKYLVLASHKLKNHFGFLCSNVRWWKNNDPCNMPTISGHGWTDLASSDLIRVKEATFVSFLVPRYMVNKYGIPMAKAVIWGDDTEYSRRMSSKAPSYFVGKSIIIHYASNPDLSCENLLYESTNNRIARYKYMYRNRLYVEKKYGTFKSFTKWLIRFTLIFIQIPFKSRNRRCMRMFYATMGILSGLCFNPKIKYSHNNRI